MTAMLLSSQPINSASRWISTMGFIATICAIISGCAPSQKTTLSVSNSVVSNAATISSVRSWLASRSMLAKSMSVTGDIAVDQNGSTTSASFSMKSKRLADLLHTNSDVEESRLDSLSIEVSGPFGIKLARFLASPEKYQFYDILHGEPISGTTDAHSLEELTHLRGVSLSAMNDIIYGIAGSDLNSDDSLQFFSNGNRHRLIIRNMNARITEQLVFEGELPNDSTSGNLSLVEFIRWNSIVDPASSPSSPDVVVRFSSPIVVNGVSIPQHIAATAGENKLTLDYDQIEINSRSLVVKIKMPSQ